MKMILTLFAGLTMSCSCTPSNSPPPVQEEPTLVNSQLSVRVGEPLNLSIEPDIKVKWAVEDMQAASVDPSGLLRTFVSGPIYIEASAGNSLYKVLVASVSSTLAVSAFSPATELTVAAKDSLGDRTVVFSDSKSWQDFWGRYIVVYDNVSPPKSVSAPEFDFSKSSIIVISLELSSFERQPVVADVAPERIKIVVPGFARQGAPQTGPHRTLLMFRTNPVNSNAQINLWRLNSRQVNDKTLTDLD